MISHKYDELFAKYAKQIPIPYLRALSYSESSLNPDSITPKDSPPTKGAWGLFQTITSVLKDYNLAHGTSYTLTDMKDPDKGSRVGIELLERIVKNLAKNHPKSLTPDWHSKRYVELLTASFNAGYSEASGLGFVVGKLEGQGIEPEGINVDNVVQAARVIPSATKYLQMEDRKKYWKAVAGRYLKEIEAPNPQLAPPHSNLYVEGPKVVTPTYGKPAAGEAEKIKFDIHAKGYSEPPKKAGFSFGTLFALFPFSLLFLALGGKKKRNVAHGR